MKYKTITPNLRVNDMTTAVAFYREVLGFELRMAVTDDKSTVFDGNVEGKNIVYVQLVRDDIEIMLQGKNSLNGEVPGMSEIADGASLALYTQIEDIDALYDGIKDKAKVIKELETTWYGMREFYITDTEGYIIAFAEQDPDFDPSKM